MAEEVITNNQKPWFAVLLIVGSIVILLACAGGFLYPPLPKFHRFGFSVGKEIQKAGGMQKLLSECRSLAEKQNPEENWLDKNLFPPAVAALQPQRVEIRKLETPPVVDIQLCGGYYHYGLIVVCDNQASTFVPAKASWKVKKVGEFVFEYKE